ncbi:alpha/beta hydrolase [Mycobacterium sp. KBS0706]|uniref:alpha/beta hydrolase n=1 Tax=Mycobacterium sp. KBS0706 TaxID=2578109 RepID=UPI00110F7069|nr:alpha/beta hydrolase [Mycobacterium sp. KBS0706]TSD84033.1 alpha/beta hydrolase [Mycobacterium sp. KBS0706]
MAVDPQITIMLERIAAVAGDTPPTERLSPAEARRGMAAVLPLLNEHAPAVARVEDRTLPGPAGPVAARFYDPGTADPSPAIVYIHGGGWVLCDLDSHDGVCRELAQRSGLKVVSIGYRLAPEHPFPAPLEDCVAAVRWLAAQGRDWGIDPGRMVIAGDSAGANLALSTLLALRDAGERPLRGAALVYGVFAPEHDTPSHLAYGGDNRYFLSTAEMEWFWGHYVPAGTDRRTPLAAPLYADLADLPPLYLTAAEYDCLRTDSEQLAYRLAVDRRPHEFRLWRGMIHACLHMAGNVEAMRTEIDHLAAFLRRQATA